MNVRRFTAPTAREALSKARMAFGDSALILSNRSTAGGVEVIATSEDTINAVAGDGVQERAASSPAPRAAAPRALAAPAREAAVVRPAIPGTQALAASAVEQDADQLAMSTLSFQDYVRERMLRRRAEAMQQPTRASATGAASAAVMGDNSFQARAALSSPSPTASVPRGTPDALINLAASLQREAAASNTNMAPIQTRTTQTTQRATAPAAAPTTPAATPAPATSSAVSTAVIEELHAMREMIEERFTTLSWLGQAKQDPLQSNLMLKLIRSGYSPSVVRAVLERMPEGMAAADAIRWVMEVLEHNVLTDANSKPIYVQGGVYALVGATGVGKTTTTAKLAAMCAKTHGPQSVGLITLDTYRIAAHEQLRAYGRMLGVVAHLAHDRAALQDLLGLLANKKMVLIDTTGMAPRDPRTQDLLDVLNLPRLNRLLVLNAGGHSDMQDEVFNAYRTNGQNSVILTKLDEAVKIGPAVDTCIRHQLVLRGITRGQRVPEDWEQPNAGDLVRASMRSVGKSAMDPKPGEVGLLFANAGPAVRLERANHA